MAEMEKDLARFLSVKDEVLEKFQGKGNKENLMKEITCNPSTAASKQRKLAYHETCSEVESNSVSPHHKKEH